MIQALSIVRKANLWNCLKVVIVTVSTIVLLGFALQLTQYLFDGIILCL